MASFPAEYKIPWETFRALTAQKAPDQGSSRCFHSSTNHAPLTGVTLQHIGPGLASGQLRSVHGVGKLQPFNSLSARSCAALMLPGGPDQNLPAAWQTFAGWSLIIA